MSIGQVKTIMVIGAETMGQQIAMGTALNGRTNDYQVILYGPLLGAVERVQKWAADYLLGRVVKDRITQSEANRIPASLSFSRDMDGAAARADIVIRAIIEDLKIKRELFGRISKPYRLDTILGTSSSSLVSSKLTDVTQNPQRLLNIHYFNPALVMQSVELVRGPHTAPEVIEAAKAFTANTGEAPIAINKEISSFVADCINATVTHETCSLLKKGTALVEDIDTAYEKGLGYPMRSFRLMNLTGIDINYYVRRDRYAESGDEYDKPSPLVIEKFQKGEFGRKTGKGWYDYSTVDRR